MRRSRPFRAFWTPRQSSPSRRFRTLPSAVCDELDLQGPCPFGRDNQKVGACRDRGAASATVIKGAAKEIAVPSNTGGRAAHGMGGGRVDRIGRRLSALAAGPRAWLHRSSTESPLKREIRPKAVDLAP